MGARAVRGPALNGTGSAWGVEDRGGGIYEAMFTKETAEQIARLCRAHPAWDWYQTRAELIARGCTLNDPGNTNDNAEGDHL